MKKETEERAGCLLDVLLGIVPSTASVGHGNGNLDTTSGGTWSNVKTMGRAGWRTDKESSEARLAEEVADNDRGEDDKGPGREHLPQRRRGGNGNALLVLGHSSSLENAGNLSDEE